MNIKRKDQDRDAAPPVPLSGPIAVATLSRAAPRPVDLAPKGEELEAVARFLGILSLEQLRFKGALQPSAADGWVLQGRLTAQLHQACVITLTPVAERIDQTVARPFVPAEEIEESEAIDLDPDAADDPDPFTDTIDPGAAIVEELALALDPYPRADDAALETQSFAAPGIEPLKDEDLRPFSGLAALRDKLAAKKD